MSVKTKNNNLIVNISCPDQQGIVAAVSKYVSDFGGNIIDLQQYSKGLDAHFFMRIVIDTKALKCSLDEFQSNFSPIADKYLMHTKFSSNKKSMAILVSKYDHCLLDVLQKNKYGDLNLDIPVIISNHPDLKYMADSFGIEYVHLPIEKDKFTDIKEAKKDQEQKILALLKEKNIDFIALARYMQVLSGDFIDHYPSKIINVHHSFLPSFKGAKPYNQAHDKGVKIIGATAHYATEDLDMGPIITQDICRVDHRDKVDDFVSKGRDIEKLVFASALKAHAEDRIIVFEGRTIVFD